MTWVIQTDITGQLAPWASYSRHSENMKVCVSPNRTLLAFPVAFINHGRWTKNACVEMFLLPKKLSCTDGHIVVVIVMSLVPFLEKNTRNLTTWICAHLLHDEWMLGKEIVRERAELRCGCRSGRSTVRMLISLHYFVIIAEIFHFQLSTESNYLCSPLQEFRYYGSVTFWKKTWSLNVARRKRLTITFEKSCIFLWYV